MSESKRGLPLSPRAKRIVAVLTLLPAVMVVMTVILMLLAAMIYGLHLVLAALQSLL
jgi:hypothetical protein